MKKVPNKKLPRFLHWLRLWNPRWFPNPFFSPGYQGWWAGHCVVEGFNKAIEKVDSWKITLRDFSPPIKNITNPRPITWKHTPGFLVCPDLSRFNIKTEEYCKLYISLFGEEPVNNGN